MACCHANTVYMQRLRNRHNNGPDTPTPADPATQPVDSTSDNPPSEVPQGIPPHHQGDTTTTTTTETIGLGAAPAVDIEVIHKKNGCG